MFSAVRNNGYGLSVDECYECVRYRVVCETSYTWNAPYIQKAKAANRQKNLSYFKEFNVQVYDIISDSSGNIKNPEILKNL